MAYAATTDWLAIERHCTAQGWTSSNSARGGEGVSQRSKSTARIRSDLKQQDFYRPVSLLGEITPCQDTGKACDVIRNILFSYYINGELAFGLRHVLRSTHPTGSATNTASGIELQRGNRPGFERSLSSRQVRFSRDLFVPVEQAKSASAVYISSLRCVNFFAHKLRHFCRFAEYPTSLLLSNSSFPAVAQVILN